MKQRTYIDRMVKLGMLTALSIILVYAIHFPIFPTAAFLEYDMADVPILIGTFLYGPWWGLGLTAVVSVLQWLLVSPQSLWVGAVMHFLATGSYVVAAGLIYSHNKTRTAVLFGMALGALLQTLMMIPMNLIFTVHFFNTHGRPEKFPMDFVIFNGHITKEEFIEERGDQWARYEEQGITEKFQVEKSSGVLYDFFFKGFGFSAVLTGLMLVCFVLYTFYS